MKNAIGSEHLDAALEQLKRDKEFAKNREKDILSKKKQLAKVREIYPDADWTVLPNNKYGYTSLQINENTPRGCRLFFYMGSGLTIQLAYYWYLSVKIGNQNVIVANPTRILVTLKMVLDMINELDILRMKDSLRQSRKTIKPEKEVPELILEKNISEE